MYIYSHMGPSQVALVVKNPPANAGDNKRHSFNPWVRKIPWRRAWQPTLVFLPGEFHVQRSLESYSSWGGKESDTTKGLTHTHTHPLFQKTALGPVIIPISWVQKLRCRKLLCAGHTARRAGSQSCAGWLQSLISPGHGASPLKPEESCPIQP